MHISFFQLLLVALTLTMLGSLMVVMVRGNLRAKFPLFFAFIGLLAASVVIALVTLVFAYKQYFYVYWSLSTLVMILGFAVMYEVFVNILKPYSAVIDLAKTLFSWAGLFLLVAGFLTAMVTSGPGTNKMVVAIDLCDRCVHMMQCGLLMLIVLLEKRLNFSWRSSGMSIALGLGIMAAFDLIVSYGDARFPQFSQWDLVYQIAVIGVLGFWIYNLTAAEKETKASTEPAPRLVLQRWNEALIGYGYGDRALASGSVDSFLPGVEQTVDRVMARKMVQ